MSAIDVDVAVVGAGIAGLSAAYELSRRGVSFVVLESGSRAGGVILSEDVDGFTIDAGPDALLIQKPEAIRLCREIGLGDRLVPTLPPRVAYIQRGGRLHALPAASVLGIPTRIAPFLRTRLFSAAGKARMGAELFVPRRRADSDDDESIGSFMTRRFGREACEYLAEPLLAGIHAGDVDRLSMQALFPRIFEAERTSGSVIRAFRAQARSPSNAPNPDGAFYSLPRGLTEMVEALVGALGAGRLVTNSAVETIDGNGPFTLRTSSGATVTARGVVLATPAFATGRLLRGRGSELSRVCESIPYASVATVALAYDRSAVTNPLRGSGFVVPRVERTGILAASWLSSKWPGRAPHDRVLLRTFIGGARDPDALALDDHQLVERSRQALQPVLGMTRAPLFTRVYRWPRANAQHEVGHRKLVAVLEAALSCHRGLFVTGSGFRGAGIPDCVADGRKTGEAAAGWLMQSEKEKVNFPP